MCDNCQDLQQRIDILESRLDSIVDLLHGDTNLHEALDQHGAASLADFVADPDVETDLDSRVRRLEEATSVADGGAVPTTDWDRDRQVRHVRAAAYDRARDAANNRAAYDYNDVGALFREDISNGHRYKLLKLAADYDATTKDSSKPGFTFDPKGGENQRLLVNADAVNDDAAFHAVNKETRGEGVE